MLAISKNYITGAYNSLKKPIIKLVIHDSLKKCRFSNKSLKRILYSICRTKSSYFKITTSNYYKADIEINIIKKISAIENNYKLFGFENNYIVSDNSNNNFSKWYISIENLESLNEEYIKQSINFFLLCFVYEIFIIWKLLPQKSQYLTNDNLLETLMYYFSHSDCGCIFDESKCTENI